MPRILSAGWDNTIKGEMAGEKNSKWGGLFITLFCLPFCAGGLIALYFALQELGAGIPDLNKLIVLGGCGVVFTAAGFGLLYAYHAGAKIQRREQKRQARACGST